MRWGFLGASRIGHSRLAPAVRGAGGHLVAVAAADPARAVAYAAENGFGRAEASYAALVEAHDIDAVYVSLTNDLHVPWAIRALEAGKSVLCEKPLALDAAQVRQLQAVQVRGSAQVMEAFVPPFHPQFAWVQERVQGGDLGELRSGQAAFMANLNRPGDFRWQRGRGGGALLDVGGYAVSALRWLSGQGPRQVSAAAQWRGEVDATLSGLLSPGAQGGFSATLTCSLDSAAHQALRLWGTAGEVVMERPFSAIDQAVGVWVGGQRREFAACNPYVNMVRAFSDACQSGQPVPLSLDDSLVQSRTLDALLSSARSGQSVDV